MSNKYFSGFILMILLISCASIPKETIQLSKVLGNDLEALRNSHENTIELYYEKINNDINDFVDEVYAPFVIHYVLAAELEKFNDDEESLYSVIHEAGKVGGQAETEAALNTMLEFQKAAIDQIQSKRNELLSPVRKQKAEVLNEISRLYYNMIYANTTITGYLESISKIKETQQQALTMVGIQGADTAVTNTLLQVSDLVNSAVKKGKAIDVKSEDALLKIEEISNEIKNITN